MQCMAHPTTSGHLNLRRQVMAHPRLTLSEIGILLQAERARLPSASETLQALDSRACPPHVQPAIASNLSAPLVLCSKQSSRNCLPPSTTPNPDRNRPGRSSGAVCKP